MGLCAYDKQPMQAQVEALYNVSILYDIYDLLGVRTADSTTYSADLAIVCRLHSSQCFSADLAHG
jgi:hypothetical protein